MTKSQLIQKCYDEIVRVKKNHGPNLACHHMHRRHGLRLIDANNICFIPHEQHRKQHEDINGYRKHFKYKPPLEYPFCTEDELRALQRAYSVCRTMNDLCLVWDAWIDDLK